MKKIISFIILLAVFLGGCGSIFSDKEIDRGVLADGKTPKDLYELAQDELKSGKISKALEYHEKILAAYSSSKYAMQMQLDIAYANYERKDYKVVLKQLKDFIKRNPSHYSTPYAHYLRCKSFENISQSFLDNVLTNKSEKDVQSVKHAYLCYKGLIDEFPQSDYAKDGKVKLLKLKNILAQHEFYIALYYTNNNSNIAAINRCKYIIEYLSETTSMPDALHLIAYNYDAIGSIKLAEEARSELNFEHPSYTPKYKLEN